MPTVTCFGEILWDLFPSYKNIGGAPLNVSLRLHYLGTNTFMISSVGIDKDGSDLLTYLEDQNLDISFIQIHDKHPTGKVNIQLDRHNNASFTILAPVAWDFIKVTEKSVHQVKNSDAFIFGSLASRDKLSRSTLLQLIKYSKFNVFDVNLRPPHYDMNFVVTLINDSDFVKFNREEFVEICEFLKIQKNSYSDSLLQLSMRTKTRHLCLTLGEEGAIFLSNDSIYINKGYPVKVKDSVGAGDSFLATLIHNFLLDKNPQKSLDISCATGALVASKSGANPMLLDEEINCVMKNDT